MGNFIIGIIGITLIYLMVSILISTSETYSNLMYGKNPLCKIPALLFWPLAAILYLIVFFSKMFIDYCKEVAEYYRRKRDEGNKNHHCGR